jgi:hypothetical protein
MGKPEAAQPPLVYLESDIPPGMTIAQYRARCAQAVSPRRPPASRARGAALRALALTSSLLRRA